MLRKSDVLLYKLGATLRQHQYICASYNLPVSHALGFAFLRCLGTG